MAAAAPARRTSEVTPSARWSRPSFWTTSAASATTSTPRPQYHFPGLVPGDRWCVTAANWARAYDDGVAAPVVLAATNEAVLQIVSMAALRKHAVDVPARPELARAVVLGHGSSLAGRAASMTSYGRSRAGGCNGDALRVQCPPQTQPPVCQARDIPGTRLCRRLPSATRSAVEVGTLAWTGPEVRRLA